MGTINYVRKRRAKYSGLFSFGNSKLPYTTVVFSITSATDCVSRKLGLCQVSKFTKSGGKHRCYALRAEKMFPKSCLVYKRKQSAFWAKNTWQEFIRVLVKTKLFKNITALRLNESGDFRRQSDILMAERIAKYLWKIYRIKTYCYTARRDLDFSRCKYLIVMGSGFSKPGIKGEFLAIKDLRRKPKTYGVCVGDCTTCSRCIKGKNTVVILH